MGISRKDALRQIEDLREMIEAHVEKMRSDPFNVSYNHWRRELVGWLRDVELWANNVGRRMREQVMNDVAKWKDAAGIENV